MAEDIGLQNRELVVRRQPESPPLLDEWEAHVMAADCPVVCMTDRANVRALLRYVRRLERDAAEMGDFGGSRSATAVRPCSRLFLRAADRISAPCANRPRRSAMSGDQPVVVHPIHRQAEPPPGLDEFEADIMPAVGTRTSIARSFAP
jgi:hypothetical protein